MSEATPVRLEAGLNLQRKAAMVAAGAIDHAGRVHIAPMSDFDLGRTIFGKLEGLPKMFMETKLAKDVFWSELAVAEIEASYAELDRAEPAPPIDQRLVDFMVEECDFSMEHADGSFLEHLVFCHDYSARNYSQHSPNVALLHSILGTATNTFAMDPSKIPKLKELLTDFESQHVEAFPSILRLLYNNELVEELNANMHRIDQLDSLSYHRVIDNEPLQIDAENLWINLNFHLMHFVDFMPAANWETHRNDPLLQMFETLDRLLAAAKKREATVNMAFPSGSGSPVGEQRPLIGRISAMLPPDVTLKLARKSIREYSEQCGHDLGYRLTWKA